MRTGLLNPNYKHGHTLGKAKTTEYQTWQNIRRRCYYAKETGYHNYGGRGIKVCDRWLVFDNFLEDMGTKPSPEHSLDRINNDGDYCPENCKWATRREQMANLDRLEYYTTEQLMCELGKRGEFVW